MSAHCTFIFYVIILPISLFCSFVLCIRFFYVNLLAAIPLLSTRWPAILCPSRLCFCADTWQVSSTRAAGAYDGLASVLALWWLREEEHAHILAVVCLTIPYPPVTSWRMTSSRPFWAWWCRAPPRQRDTLIFAIRLCLHTAALAEMLAFFFIGWFPH